MHAVKTRAESAVILGRIDRYVYGEGGHARVDADRAPERTSHMSGTGVEGEAAAGAVERRSVRRVYRLYCVACGRSTESPAPPPKVGRCPACGGTMLVELAAD